MYKELSNRIISKRRNDEIQFTDEQEKHIHEPIEIHSLTVEENEMIKYHIIKYQLLIR